MRTSGHRGRITLIGAEDIPGYARPSLSKGVLSGADAPCSVYLPQPNGIDVILGNAAQGLDLTGRRLVLADDSSICFDGLVIATGARAKSMPGSGEDVFTLRSMRDAILLRHAMHNAETIVVIGSGPLAMEIASAANGLGVAVTVVTNALPLQKHLGTHLAELLLRCGKGAGVNFIIDSEGFYLSRSASGRTIVKSSKGETQSADLISSAVGCVPNVDWLDGSSLEVGEHGLIVDECLGATDNVVAAGDVAAVRCPRNGVVRAPLWLNAIDQAMVAASNLLTGKPRVFNFKPFFWTELFGHRLRVAGTVRDDAEFAVSRNSRGTLYRWLSPSGEVEAAAAFDLPMPIARLRGLVTSPGPV
jgi:NADPH-dependent 2,4-dienoyl-CoA reductase/sulfur reductase-like enzyme